MCQPNSFLNGLGSEAQFIVPDWGVKVDNGIELSYQQVRLHRLAHGRRNFKDTNPLKVPKREIFDRSDFSDFYAIKSSCVGDLLVKILTYYFNF